MRGTLMLQLVAQLVPMSQSLSFFLLFLWVPVEFSIFKVILFHCNNISPPKDLLFSVHGISQRHQAFWLAPGLCSNFPLSTKSTHMGCMKPQQSHFRPTFCPVPCQVQLQFQEHTRNWAAIGMKHILWIPEVSIGSLLMTQLEIVKVFVQQRRAPWIPDCARHALWPSGGLLLEHDVHAQKGERVCEVYENVLAFELLHHMLITSLPPNCMAACKRYIVRCIRTIELEEQVSIVHPHVQHAGYKSFVNLNVSNEQDQLRPLS
mmetsp:Transcript_85812/g.175184  ORF Transcript_85812/g.175184 Transcript_85812/m.175184 type:complete len:262 (+) Transcript_85812:324-1109(+)